ncbi:MAG: T9SS type A sorting domain-containing protein [Melioribacteraceae bacterium]|nr:T9SS type A sorting domain-containing protein [Melioribacteraceae bacterium]
MKRLLTTLLFVVLAGSSYGQYYFQPCENSVASGFWNMETLYDNGQGKAKMDLLDYTADKKQGNASLKIDYVIAAGDGWGGYIVRATPLPLPDYYDLSAGTHLSFWYKVVTPLVTTAAGSTFMEFKMGDVDSENRRDLWYREMPIDLADASGQWKQVVVDLASFKDGGDKTSEWALQFGDGDREIQLDKIKTFEMALVYITTGNQANPPTASGVVLLDGFEITGNRYTPIFTFDNSASGWNIDWMDWAGNDKGALAVSDENTDKVEGTGSLKLTYTLSAPFVWGGFLSIDKDVTKPDKFEERTALVLYVKNLTPLTADPDRAFLRVFLIENSSGANEEWIIDANVDFSKPFDWTRCYLPFVEKPMGVNDRFPPKNGFALKNNAGNKQLDPASITKIRIEIFGRGTEDGFAGPLKSNGSILFDVLQQSGFQFSDKEAPSAPAGFTVIKGNYTNLITWTDVAGETNEKYNVYYSKKPITDLNAPDVLAIKTNILEGTQVVDHLLLAPQNDKDITFYYAVNCVDKAGNIGPAAVSSAIVNKGKGIPTISLNPPVNFVADGSLAEWAHIRPFVLKPSNGSATIVNNFIVTNDADCSADCYVAIDKDYLYVAFNVNDDVVYDDPAYYARGNSWALDATDLEFGLYNQTGKPHTSYQRGSKPDYHLRFNKLRLRNDHWTNEKDSLLLPGPNYYWAEKFPAGYIIESKISLSDLANLRRSPTAVKDTIYVKEGYQIPFDIVINDNDGGTSGEDWRNREGMISWSPFNQDQGWQYPNVWLYTWIGNTDQVTTDVEESLPFSYSLEQNYPNPFNPATQIKYSIAKAGHVSVKIFDILGRVVSELVNKQQEPGSYTVDFNGSKLASGIYFYRIESGSFINVKKMALIK